MRHAKCPVMTLRATDVAVPKRKISQILVPVDFSVYGYAAVDFASKMALATHAHLTICYVDELDDTVAANFLGSPVDPKQHQEEIWEQLRKFEPTSMKVDFTHKLLVGSPGEKICEYATSKPFDFVVIGTRGRSGLTRAIMGSVAEYIVRHADCPVISVKPSNERAHVLG